MPRTTKRKKTEPKPAAKLPEKLPANHSFSLAKPTNPKCSPGKQREADLHSYIKMLLVPIGPSNGYGMYFDKIGDPPASSSAAKLMFDKVRVNNTASKWVSDINIYNVSFELHRDNVAVVNNRQYAVRVYVGFAGEELTSTILLEIAKVVENNINSMGELRGNQTVKVDPETFLESIDASWYDYLGHEGARKLAKKVLHEDNHELGKIFIASGSMARSLFQWHIPLASLHIWLLRLERLRRRRMGMQLTLFNCFRLG